jgi:hypothetical protein
MTIEQARAWLSRWRGNAVPDVPPRTTLEGVARLLKPTRKGTCHACGTKGIDMEIPPAITAKVAVALLKEGA